MIEGAFVIANVALLSLARCVASPAKLADAVAVPTSAFAE